MPSGLPDFWQGTIAGLPTIGAGQVAWFQSELVEVAAGGNEDLISYVVPDIMELHVCSGVISCAFPRLQRYKLVTTPAATWISPTSHSDPDNKWSFEEEAYDGDLATLASPFTPAGSWSGYLILLLNEVYINKIKFSAIYQAAIQNSVDVDVYYGGAWHDVYEGAYAPLEWVEKDIPAGVQLVSKARIRFYNNDDEPRGLVLYEFMFNTSGETAQEGIYFDTHAIIPYLPQAPYIVPAEATFAVRVFNDDGDAHNMSVSLAGFLQSKA